MITQPRASRRPHGTTRLIDNTIVVPKGTGLPSELRELLEADAVASAITNH